MGYCMYQSDTNFSIPATNIKRVISAIHALASDKSKMNGGSWTPVIGKTDSWYSWVNMNFVNTNDIKEIFNCWRWDITTDDEGNIIDIYFDGSKLGDDAVLFEAIAPYVKDGSYIQMQGEDEALWRWCFSNGTLEEKPTTITW